eukprot:2087210-Pleurochrysis_carterae.AAC.1
MSERLCRVARHVNVGESDRPVAPDFACRIALALARRDFAPASYRESLQLLRRGVLGRDTTNHPQQRCASEQCLRSGRYATSSALRKPLTYRTHIVARRLARRSGASGRADEAIRQ